MDGLKSTREPHCGMVPYEGFDAWKIAHELALNVYEATEQWPANEGYGLTARSAVLLFRLQRILPRAPQSGGHESFAAISIYH